MFTVKVTRLNAITERKLCGKADTETGKEA